MFNDRTTPELLGELAQETATLVRQELALARTEMVEKLDPIRAASASFGAAAGLALMAAGALTATLIAALALVMPVWAAALIVTVVLAVAAVVAIAAGRAKLKAATPLAPRQTAQTVKEDIAWIKTQASSKK